MPAFSFPASAIISGTMAQARLGSGSGGSGLKYLADDQTWKTIDLSLYLPLAGGTLTGGLTVTGDIVIPPDPGPFGFATTYLYRDGSAYFATGGMQVDSAGNVTAASFTGDGSGLTSLPSHNHAAADITSGTIATDRLGSGAANSSTFLRGDQTWQTVAASPGGSDTQVQFNDGGSFGGDSGLTFNKATDALTVAGPLAAASVVVGSSGNPTLTINNSGYANTAAFVTNSGQVNFIPANGYSAFGAGSGNAVLQIEGAASRLIFFNGAGDNQISTYQGDLYLAPATANVGVSGSLTSSGTLSPGTYTVATLPTAGTARRMAYASNGRKAGEGAGAGTGVIVFDDGTAWRACDTGATVAA